MTPQVPVYAVAAVVPMVAASAGRETETMKVKLQIGKGEISDASDPETRHVSAVRRPQGARGRWEPCTISAPKPPTSGLESLLCDAQIWLDFDVAVHI
jgi:hypothetical protein